MKQSTTSTYPSNKIEKLLNSTNDDDVRLGLEYIIREAGFEGFEKWVRANNIRVDRRIPAILKIDTFHIYVGITTTWISKEDYL